MDRSTEADKSQCQSQYAHIIIRGLPYDRGLSYGRQAKDKILKSLDYYKNSKALPPWSECVEFCKENYLTAIKKYYPRGLREMQGIGDAVGVAVEEILVLNARYDLSRVQTSKRVKASLKKAYEDQKHGKRKDAEAAAHECTGAVALKSATKSGHVLLAQNWDINKMIWEEDLALLLEVHPDPSENIKPFVVFTEAGQLGRSGMNSDGLGVVGMSLWSTNEIYERDPQHHPHGWMPITLLRRMFLEAPNFSMGIKAILHTPRHVASCLIIATREDEALALEIVPDHYFVINPPLDKNQEFLSHSNHFQSQAFLSRSDMGEGSRGSSSLFRDRRVAKELRAACPLISEETIQTAFKDHVGYPNSVCSHIPEDPSTSAFPNDMTVASVIYNLTSGTLQLCKGPPCIGTYVNYNL